MTDSPTGSGLTPEREQEFRREADELGVNADVVAEIDRLRAERDKHGDLIREALALLGGKP